MQLTAPKLDQISSTLQTYAPSQKAIATLNHYNGDLEASLKAQAGTPTYGTRSLKTVTLQVLRKNICGDDSFRSKLQKYTKNKDSDPLLTAGLIHSMQR